MEVGVLFQISGDPNAVVDIRRRRVSGGIVHFLQTFDSNGCVAARVDGQASRCISDLTLSIRLLGVIFQPNHGRPFTAESSEHGCRLDDINMLMEMLRQAIACSANEIIAARLVFIDVVFLTHA